MPPTATPRDAPAETLATWTPAVAIAAALASLAAWLLLAQAVDLSLGVFLAGGLLTAGASAAAQVGRHRGLAAGAAAGLGGVLVFTLALAALLSATFELRSGW